ncbi:MAG: hypothetical protein Q7R57_07915 [Dehalococcoidales bacterium]|nr:hypothetical protein [Dehalococcoidales bacterium]
MENEENRVEYAARHTEILRPPKQTLATFGTTNIYYYLLTEPAYTEITHGAAETVIREGRVIAQRPRIVTPYYLTHLEGFSPDARKYFDVLTRAYGLNAPGLFYTYRNEPKELNIVSDSWPVVVDRLNQEIDQRGDPLTSIIKGEDALWDVSLLKFIYEVTRGSVQSNVSQLGARGLLNMDSSGVPMDGRLRIEELFESVGKGECEPRVLKDELDRWNIFAEYEDRFLGIFKRRR